MTGPDDSDEARVDDLRRRLYGPGATDDDLRRYLEHRPVPREPGSAAGTAETAVRPSERISRPIRTLGVGALVVAAAAAAIVVARPGEGSSDGRPSADARASSAVLTEDVGEGEVLRVRTDAAAAPTRIRTEIRGAAVAGQRFTGRGNAVVDVAVPEETTGGGRMRVALSAGGTAIAAWRALLIVHGDDRTSYALVAARGLSDGTSTAGATGVFVYPAQPPTRIAVASPPGRRWTLVVAVAGGLGDPR